MADILIIEPDVRVCSRMRDVLNDSRHTCIAVTNVAEGAQAVMNNQRMLTILNARLPWSESFSLLHTLEERGWPVLFITSDASNVQHLHALYQASCGVLLAPFDAQQLRTCVDSLLTESARTLTMGPLRIDTTSREATLDGELLTLTAQEFALLHALMQSPDAAVTREHLLRTAWGYQGIGETRTVDVHIQRLRRKLGPSCIETVYKLGYRLKMA